MASIRLRPIGRCIYCGQSGLQLTKEHLIPFALNGQWTLPASSCNNCARVTSKFELSVTRTAYLALRTKKGFRTRNPKSRPTFFQATIVPPDGRPTQISIPAADYPTIYPVLNLPPPGILNDAPLSDSSPEMHVAIGGNSTEISQLVEGHKDQGELVLTVDLVWSDLCRMLAKIAHAYTVGYLGDEGFEFLLPEIILGTSPFISHVVGGTVDVSKNETLSLQDGLSITVLPQGFIVVHIDILGGRLPRYAVVSGRITDWTTVLTAASRVSRDGRPV